MLEGMKRIVSGVAMVLAFSAMATTPVQADSKAVIYSADFETSDITSQINTSGNKPTISCDIARAGRCSMKSVLNRQTSQTSYRTEANTGGKVKVQPGQDVWYGFSIYLPADYAPDHIWEVVAQWHNVPDTNIGESNTQLNPPMGVYIEDGEWRLNTLWDSRAITNKANYEGKAEYRLGAPKLGKWTDWVFHIKWSPRSDGILQVWMNGEKVVDKDGPIGFNDAEAPFFKMGIYKGWRNRSTPSSPVSQRVLYHDELKIAGPGGTYADVAPAGDAPEDPIKPKPPTSVSVDQK